MTHVKIKLDVKIKLVFMSVVRAPELSFFMALASVRLHILIF